MWGSAFKNADANTAEVVKSLNMVLREHFGHAAPRVIQFIQEHKADWPLWKKAYEELRHHFSRRAGIDPVAGRISDYFATLACVIPLIHAALPELRRDMPLKAIIDDLWAVAIKGTDEADRALTALQYAYSYAVENQGKFWLRNTQLNEPSGGWLGSWDSADDWKYIAFTTTALRAFLAKQEFDVEAVLKTWKDRGWLETDKLGRGKQVRISGAVVNCYCVTRTAITTQLKIKDIGEDAS